MEDERIEEQPSTSPPSANRWLAILVILMFCASAIGGVYLLRERRNVRESDARNAELSASLIQTRSQVEALTAKLNSMTATPPAEEISPASATSIVQSGSKVQEASPTRPRPRRGLAKVARRTRSEDPRWKQVQAKLGEHEKEIESNRKDLQKARTELEDNLKSTKDELNGSIARTHDELVVLGKKGERNYYEFDLAKTKEFQRVGPLSVSLRKANTKREYYDVVVLVEDNQLTKKHVNLYEPVLFYPSDSRVPLELVVNRIDKDRVHGYVSEPKYKPSELAATATPTTGTVPVPASDATGGLAHRPESNQ